MTSRPRVTLLFRALALALTGAALGAAAVVVFFLPAADPLMTGFGPAGSPLGVALRLLLALLVSGGLAAGLALGLFRSWSRDLTRTSQILQESSPPADHSDAGEHPPGGFAESAGRLAETAHRGRETRDSLKRLEESVMALARRLELVAGDELESWPHRAEADPAEQALLKGLNVWIEGIRSGRDRTAGLLAEVEDHLVGVHEAVNDVARALAGVEAPAARDRLLRVRTAVMRVERELAAVRRRMGGAPVERLTENDFIGPESGGPATQE